MISKFHEITGVPILVNTSFNIRGEPIVCSIEDAYRCFLTTELDFLVCGNQILDRKPKVVGVFRLIMKSGSDNFRNAAVQGIMQRLQANGVELVIYEPALEDEEFEGLKVIKNIDKFKSISDVIVANRLSDSIFDVKGKVYTRDIFNTDV